MLEPQATPRDCPRNWQKCYIGIIIGLRFGAWTWLCRAALDQWFRELQGQPLMQRAIPGRLGGHFGGVLGDILLLTDFILDN